MSGHAWIGSSTLLEMGSHNWSPWSINEDHLINSPPITTSNEDEAKQTSQYNYRIKNVQVSMV